MLIKKESLGAMKKTKLTRSLMAACSIVALSAVMYGCVHSGDGGEMDTGMEMPEPMPTPAELLAAAQTALADAQAAVDAAVTAEQISAAYAALATAQAQVAAAAALPENQIAALNDSLRQLRTDLEEARMLAGQRDTVGTALRAAQSAVNGLSNDSSDEDVAAAAAAVMDAQDALAAATALPDDDALRSSVAAVASALDTATMARTVHMQQGTVGAALATARDAVDGLSNTSSDDDVAAAGTAVMDAQTALADATALAADDPLHAMVAGVYMDLGTAVNARTAHAETEDINGLIATAMMEVDGLDQVNSSVQAVSDAHTAVQAALAAIAAATQADTAALTAKLAADAGDALTAIVTFRNTPAGSLEVANAALAHANVLVAALTSSSSADEAREAYQALADAQVAVRIAVAHPENMIANLNDQLMNVQNQLTDTQTATAAVVTATTAMAGLNNDSAADLVVAARTAVDAAQTALDNAVNVSDADRTSLQAAITSLENALSPIEMAVAERPTPEEIAAAEEAAKAATKAAGTKETAITTEAKQTTDAGVGGTLATDVTDSTYSLAIKRPRSGTEVTIADTAQAGDDDPKFAKDMDVNSMTSMHVRTQEEDEDDGSVESEVVMVTTDIEEPTATKFATVYPFDVTKETGTGATGDDENDSLDIPDNANPTEGELAALMRVMASAFTAGTAATLTFLPAREDDDSTTDVDEERAAYETTGTYDGAMGRYTCTGTANCTVDLDAEGMITAMEGGWVFTPALGVTVDVLDTDYLHYGFWLKRTTDEDGAVTYNEVETFAGSSLGTQGSDVSQVTGSATYNGGATGVYVHSLSNPDGTRASATSGHFTADAELTAYFDQTVDDTTTENVDEAGAIPPRLLNTISGTIDNFDLAGHDEGPGWSVSLEMGEFEDSQSPADGVAHVTDGVAKGGGADGSYTATFFGATSVTVDGDTTNFAPDAVVGEFNANFSNGSVAGAYGAREDD